MKGFLVALVLSCTLGLAVWSYSEIYTSKKTLDQISDLNRDIAAAKSRLRKLNAEWAYLNRPERLAELSVSQFRHLGLTTLTRDHFVPLEQVPLAGAIPMAAPLEPISTPVEIMNRGGAQ